MKKLTAIVSISAIFPCLVAVTPITANATESDDAAAIHKDNEALQEIK